jgi:hypothetical protein
LPTVAPTAMLLLVSSLVIDRLPTMTSEPLLGPEVLAMSPRAWLAPFR